MNPCRGFSFYKLFEPQNKKMKKRSEKQSACHTCGGRYLAEKFGRNVAPWHQRILEDMVHKLKIHRCWILMQLLLNKQPVTQRKSIGGLAFRSYSFHETSPAGKLEDFCFTHHRKERYLLFVARVLNPILRNGRRANILTIWLNRTGTHLSESPSAFYIVFWGAPALTGTSSGNN